MKVYGIYTTKYEGFGFTNDLQEETNNWNGTAVIVIDIGTANDEEGARNACDYLTAVNNGTERPVFDTTAVSWTEAGLQLIN